MTYYIKINELEQQLLDIINKPSYHLLERNKQVSKLVEQIVEVAYNWGEAHAFESVNEGYNGKK